MDTPTPPAWATALDRFTAAFGSRPNLTDLDEDVPAFLTILAEVIEERRDGAMVEKIREATARLLEQPL